VSAFNIIGESGYTAPWTVTVRLSYRIYLPLVSKNHP
jgi:hypothetical protein